ncbi:MAG: peptidylprolyl isomerase [Betaproteobacteria bacterium]|nr:peptidylprolyl isomerase [Betaproteobacteria bacterium]
MFRKFFRVVFCLGMFAMLAVGSRAFANPVVELQTSQGQIVLELDSARAPESVANFLEYVRSGFYKGTIFHRVMPNFMIQGGGFTPDMAQKAPRHSIRNEAANGLKNQRGSIAMARTQDPQSATAQFFINVVDNDFLNFKAQTPSGWGYAVFGKVTKGMEVVDKIVAVPTHNRGMHQNVPVDPVVIQSATIVSE